QRAREAGARGDGDPVEVARGDSGVLPVMLALFAIGLAWIVVFFVTDGTLPMESLRNWNVAVGFGFIAAGFAVSTQWK
ncbi:cell division protein CrgA, partial [Streptomyces fradiae]|uniref:cell division protein CrgA n=1 Tax=Streptomyces fradiae TaxID=1906 RepID=UPI00341D7F7F